MSFIKLKYINKIMGILIKYYSILLKDLIEKLSGICGLEIFVYLAYKKSFLMLRKLFNFYLLLILDELIISFLKFINKFKQFRFCHGIELSATVTGIIAAISISFIMIVKIATYRTICKICGGSVRDFPFSIF